MTSQPPHLCHSLKWTLWRNHSFLPTTRTPLHLTKIYQSNSPSLSLFLPPTINLNLMQMRFGTGAHPLFMIMSGKVLDIFRAYIMYRKIFLNLTRPVVVAKQVDIGSDDELSGSNWSDDQSSQDSYIEGRVQNHDWQ